MIEVICEEGLEEGLDGFGDCVVDAVEVFGGDYVRGEDVDDVAQRAEEDAAIEEEIVELGTERREIARIVDAEFESRDGADLAGVADLMEGAEMREALGVNASDGRDAIEDRLVVENLETGVGCGTGKRVPGVGMAMIESVEAIFAAEGGLDAVGAQRDAHSQESTGDAFGNAH